MRGRSPPPAVCRELPRLLPGLEEPPAPTGTGRADVPAPTAALPGGDRDGPEAAPGRLSLWLPRVARETAGPNAALRDGGRAAPRPGSRHGGYRAGRLPLPPETSP
ncbi:hypothetical protein GCM10010446_15430 [Streptomyces enissocaesilis]|uniref:Uncharacterized protein n=1 Tax=Streptomyces enissocaesilis TaxID=332589 RepID=A0ABP6JHH6_9ACTN